MFSLIIWWLSALLEGAVLWRILRGRLFVEFPVFFGYIVFVLSQSIVRYSFRANQRIYGPLYWSTEFLALLIGSFIVFEVYRLALKPYPGTARMTRNVLIFVFALALARAISVYLSDPYVLHETTALQIERALRTFQAIAIFVLVTILLSYSITLDRNVRGVLLGYSLFIGERVLCLAFVGETGKGFWFYAYSASYLAALGVWLTQLWSPAFASRETAEAGLGQDYNVIASKTHQRLQEARVYLKRMAGS